MQTHTPDFSCTLSKLHTSDVLLHRLFSQVYRSIFRFFSLRHAVVFT